MLQRLIVFLLPFLAATSAEADQFDDFKETWSMHQEYCGAALGGPRLFMSGFQETIRQYGGEMYEADHGEYVFIAWINRLAYFSFAWKVHPEGYNINCLITVVGPLSLDHENVSHDIEEIIDADSSLSGVGGRLVDSQTPSDYQYSILGLIGSTKSETAIHFSERYFRLSTHASVRY